MCVIVIYCEVYRTVLDCSQCAVLYCTADSGVIGGCVGVSVGEVLPVREKKQENKEVTIDMTYMYL